MKYDIISSKEEENDSGCGGGCSLSSSGLAYPAACPDCPGARLDLLEQLVGATKASCMFATGSLEAKAVLPMGWSGRYAFGLVRRGVVIQQWVDPGGRATAVDAAGPGCLITFEDQGGLFAGYAAVDALVCLCPRDVAERTLDVSARTGRDLMELMRAARARVARIAHARGCSTALRKAAALICALTDTLSPPRRRERLPAGFQQRDMATLIGVRHETLCRSLRELRSSGLIAQEPDGLRVLDRAGLEAV